MTYRIGAHSTADDAGRYRDEDEVESARAFDPIARFRTWLTAEGHVDDGVRRRRATTRSRPRSRRSARASIAQPAPPVEWMFDWTYADPPATFARQRGEALGA